MKILYSLTLLCVLQAFSQLNCLSPPQRSNSLIFKWTWNFTAQLIVAIVAKMSVLCVSGSHESVEIVIYKIKSAVQSDCGSV